MSVFEDVIGIIAPPECILCSAEGQAMCEQCAAKHIDPYGEACWNCRRRSPGGRTCPKCRLPGTPGYVWLATTYDEAPSQLLRAYKFGHLRAASATLAKIMVSSLNRYLPGEALKSAGYIVVPVPTATRRRRGRGFGHSELLARKIAGRLGLQYLPALGRLGQSRQVGAKRDVRQKQADGVYYVRLPQLVKGQKLLLVDDVVTTGATMRAATKALRAAGASRVDALVFAKRL